MIKKKDIFDDLILPSDAEIKRETHNIKLAQSKIGKSGNKCSDERKRKIGEKNKVSRMSEFQRTQLIKSNKENPRHITPHTKETRMKIKKTLENKPIYKCPHCSATSKSGVLKRWHFDNCKHKL